MHQRTSLREESAESVVGVLLLALLGEVSIGLFVIKISACNLFTIKGGTICHPTYLNAVLETVELKNDG